MSKMSAFNDELQKIGSAGTPLWHDAVELGGLGALGYFPAKHLLNKNSDKGTKRESKAELAGLGVLATPNIHNIVSRLK